MMIALLLVLLSAAPDSTITIKSIDTRILQLQAERDAILNNCNQQYNQYQGAILILQNLKAKALQQDTIAVDTTTTKKK